MNDNIKRNYWYTEVQELTIEIMLMARQDAGSMGGGHLEFQRTKKTRSLGGDSNESGAEAAQMNKGDPAIFSPTIGFFILSRLKLGH